MLFAQMFLLKLIKIKEEGGGENFKGYALCSFLPKKLNINDSLLQLAMRFRNWVHC